MPYAPPPAVPETCRFCGGRRLRHVATVKGYRFLECRTCAFAFSPDVHPEDVARRYAAVDVLVEEGLPDDGWANLGFLAPALRLAEEERRSRPLLIMDFGAGESAAPDLLRARGHKVLAVDIAPPRRPHPDRLTGDVNDLELPEGGFDLIYSYQVFEHLNDPRPVFDRLLNLVRPEGLLAIHTDMEVPERAHGLAAWWYVMPPDHCAFYRHHTFASAIAGTPDTVAWRDEKMVVIRKRAESP